MKTKLFVALALVTVLSLTMMATASAALPGGSWVKYTSNPVALSGLCGVGDVSKPFVLVETTPNYKMYFTSEHTGLNAQIYLATSGNGGTSWTCATANTPVIPLGGGSAWDAARVTSPTVIKEDASHYKMWYSGRDANANWGIGYATSSDGVSWNKYGSNPVMIQGSYGAWDASIREPSVVKDAGGTYHMWYTGFANFPYMKIGHATSPNGIAWTKDVGNPILSGTPGKWDANEVYSPYVVPNGSNTYEMFYSGEGGNRWLTGHATGTLSGSTWTWTKDANAILSPSGTSWETGDSLDQAAAVNDGGTWKVFYSQGGTYQIGLATLTNQAQLTFNQLSTSVAVGSDVTVNIDLTSVDNLYGYQFEVGYDQNKVSATAAFVNGFFDASPANALVVWAADCTTPGVCKFSVTRKSALSGYSGSGTLAHITFHGLAAGSVPLTFSSDILSDKNANVIVHTSNTGFLTVYGIANLSGIVTLQGRPTPIDTGTVTLIDENGIVPPTVVNFSATNGTWNATVPVADSTTYTILAHHSLYLDNQKTGVAVTSGNSYPQTTTMLLGGDADNSGKIDISDLTIVAGQFGNSGVGITDSRANINADNDVNILDLVLVGGNYDLTSPQPWP